MSDIRVIATGLSFPEGPVAMADGSIVLVEIERQTVTRVKPDGSTEVIAHTGGGPNGLAVGPDGAFYVCNNGGFMWRLHVAAGAEPDAAGGSRVGLHWRVHPAG
jgi:gluconolactonase